MDGEVSRASDRKVSEASDGKVSGVSDGKALKSSRSGDSPDKFKHKCQLVDLFVVLISVLVHC
jgi:hypothetical protein